MYILGISCFYHDSAAALIEDGVLIAAAQEERFSRVKHDYGFPKHAIQFCLRQAGITAADLGYVVFYEKPLLKFERILLTTLGTFPRSWRTFGEAMIAWFEEKLWIKSLLMRELGVPEEKVLFTDHHMAHAASALFCSPYEEAAIMTVDGVGEWTTATLGWGRASWQDGNLNEITLSHEQRFPHSLGLLYSAFTAFLGFEVNEGEYKVMGMAPYGKLRFVDEIYKHLITVHDDGSFWLNMDYFSYHYSPEQSFGGRFVKLFGEPRVPDSLFVTTLTNPGEADPNDPYIQKNQHYADVAASIQRVTEEVLLKMAHHLYRQTGLKRLCVAGGVALNSVANGRILRETPFEDVYIQPAAGDAGGALGAALYVHHVLLHQPRRFVLEHAYWGQEYSSEEIRLTLEQVGAHYEYIPDDEVLLNRVVDALVDGKVVGFYQGRFEWGPRALGNRSILADPRRAEMKDIVNRKIKFREPFRPFAPVIPEDQVGDFFEGLAEPERRYPARYMLLVLPWKGEAGSLIPAVNHLGTGRLQTIRREWNPRYYWLVEKFGEATGVPVLLNTSFNLRGEPIVNSPADAFTTFSKGDLDTLAMGPFLVTKNGLQPDKRRRAMSCAAQLSLVKLDYVEGLICPACQGSLRLVNNAGDTIACMKCGRRFTCEDGIPLLYWPTEETNLDNVTDLVREFYEEHPFPGYEEVDTAQRLVEKARKGIFARLMDDQIPSNARVLEVGCGTGQLSNFLAIRGRPVFGTDICLNSLKLGQRFRVNNALDTVNFVQMNLFKPVFAAQSFDFILCNGVLHHTHDPFAGFCSISKLVRPGGCIVIGLYNRFGRIWTDIRRAIFRFSGNRLLFLDPYLARADVDETKKRIWFADQYMNPHESRHTIDEVLEWFDETGFEFVNSIPKPSPFANFSQYEALFETNRRGLRLEHLLAQFQLALAGGREGGFFVVIGRRKSL
jgi:carbamoyltransferase